MAKNKQKTIDSIYKKKSRLSVDGEAVENDSVQEEEDVHGEEEEVEVEDENPLRIQRVNDGSGILIVERDPGLRCQISDHPVNVQEQARKAYVKHGPYRFQKNVYPVSDSASHPRRKEL
jgi:hypothetical protein